MMGSSSSLYFDILVSLHGSPFTTFTTRRDDPCHETTKHTANDNYFDPPLLLSRRRTQESPTPNVCPLSTSPVVHNVHIGSSMPPKRGQQRKAAPQVSEPVTVAVLPPVDGVRSAVEAAVSTWDTGGQDNLRETLSSQLSLLDSNATPLAALPLSQALTSLLSSAISSDALVRFLSTFLEGLDDRQKDELSETLVDVVEVLESEREDCEDFVPANGMEVDGNGAKPAYPGQKGMEVVKALLVRPLVRPPRHRKHLA